MKEDSIIDSQRALLDPLPGIEPVASGQQEKKEILRARARELARVPESEEAAEDNLQVVEFLLANERYAVETTHIREVYPLKEITPVPCTPPYVLGIINIRGQILSIIDIKKFFDLPDKGLSDLNKVIIVHADQMEVGILADEVLGLRSIPLHILQPSLPTLTGIRAEYLRGITNERLVVLDAPRILSDPKLVVHEQVE
ncbi:MAG: chemotaxis protein CheW [Armatimonadota bacterium]|nr:chemotaxis protein CheW [Armatimonadota bacterium]